MRFLFSLLLVALLTGCSFSEKTTRRYLSTAGNQTYDMVIVPGVPFENGQWSRIMKARIYWSKYLFDKGIAKNVMYSGSSVYSPYYEAQIMALYAEAIGIPKENIFQEMRAEHSTENVYYSVKKARKLGYNSIAVASDPYQSKLLKKFIDQKINPEVNLIPIVFDTLRTLEPQMVDPVIDYEQAYNKDFKSITERENFWKRFRGTRGRNIDTTAYD